MRAAVRQGNTLDLLQAEPEAHYDLILTSPPYYRLRSYLPADHPDQALELGQEATVREYVDNLVAVCHEVRRILKPTGTLWLVLGDSYSVGGLGGAGRSSQLVGNGLGGRKRQSPYLEAIAAGPRIDRREHGVPSKSLLGVPWRVALALIDDGWRLRNEVIWHKPNALPTSARDRFKNAHEHVFFFSKEARYWSNLDAVKTPLKESSLRRIAQSRLVDQHGGDKQRAFAAAGGPRAQRPPAEIVKSLAGHLPRIGGNRAAQYGSRQYSGKAVTVRTKAAEFRDAGHADYQEPRQPVTGSDVPSLLAGGANPGDVWDIPTQPSREPHFACFPPRLCERIIRFACPPGGKVLDPFCGSGTTLLAALRLGCNAVGFGTCQAG